MLLKFLLATWLFAGAQTTASLEGSCKNGAPVEQKQVALKPYTVTLFKDVELKPNLANKNFSLFVLGGKKGSCILFSKEALLPAGEYTSQGAYGVYTRCHNTNDESHSRLAYAFTKFDSIMGKDILRIQCFKAKSDVRFAPQAPDVKYVLENLTSHIRARVTTSD